MSPARRFWAVSVSILVIAGLIRGILPTFNILTTAQANIAGPGEIPAYIKGPFVGKTIEPFVFDGDLRDLLKQNQESIGIPPSPEENEEYGPENDTGVTVKIDQVAQQSFAGGQMPDPIMNFDGLNFFDGGGLFPPDANGDVGRFHYIQTVKSAVGIYDKGTGVELINLSYNDFFQGPPDSPCDDQNAGDGIVLYDPQMDRWIVTDFALPGPDYYECIAVSQTGDPLSGGWYFYELQANSGDFENYWNDYPKLGVWADGWYMTANMFSHQDNKYGGVRVWALDREDALIGAPIDIIYFDCTDFSNCSSLLPANLRGDQPPSGSPEYLANLVIPNKINLWQFHTDWAIPENSTFTGPNSLNVADFSTYTDIPQKDTTQWKLNSLGDRIMSQLQYRNNQGTESLYINHTVMSGESGGIRWYEIRDPGGEPFIHQQSTYQPDQNYRWMASIAADQEGNIAVGYSISSSEMYPGIRYAGRLAGEIPNLLTQNEASLMEGRGPQTGSDRWGDYSSMTVDPVDDCTFWYTQEYIGFMGGYWQTRIGSFKYPSCGQDKGRLEGYVKDPASQLALAGMPVIAHGELYSFSTITDHTGFYSMSLIAGDYDLAVGPLLPEYPYASDTGNVTVTAFTTTPEDLYLTPLINQSESYPDTGNDGNFGNGDLEVVLGRQGLNLAGLLASLKMPFSLP